jgi:signal transduction histidine kinase/ActR/RegA family two-component response regulator
MSESWIARTATDYLYRGCADPSDTELRRHTALHNITAYSGILVTAIFGAVNLVQGRITAAVLILASAAILVVLTHHRHRTKSPRLAATSGVSVAGGLFLYLTATGGPDGTGYLWLPLFPLLPMFMLGRRGGTVLTLIYLVLAAILLFVPGIPGVQAYPLTMVLRLAATTLFVALLAFYYEYSRDTAHTRLSEEIDTRRRAEAEVVRASQAKSELLAAVSHEVRTPLTAMMGLSDLLLQTDLDEQQRAYLELATRSGRSLLAVVNDLLDLSRVEAGKLRIESVAFDAYELASALVDMQRVLAAEKGLTVELDWEEDVPRIVVGDPARVRQVLSNLVSNAVKFTARGSVKVRVRSVEADEETVTLSVSVDDTGVGLSEEQQASVFDAFVQTGPEEGGTGLGLAIAKNLVEAMGGEIGVLSTVGVGSSFWFRLELARSQDGAVGAASPAGEGAFRARVLLVEDNDLNRDVLRMMLQRMGCTVDTAANGEEGVSAFRDGSYDLVLMDCQMPVLDGYGAASRIRELEADGDRTPIVAITAYALPEELKRCIDVGMDDHVTKPLMLDDVVATLNRWLGQRGAESPPPENRLESHRTD